jgi:hypothetical protein
MDRGYPQSPKPELASRLECGQRHRVRVPKTTQHIDRKPQTTLPRHLAHHPHPHHRRLGRPPLVVPTKV